jgi:hypothetical protein
MMILDIDRIMCDAACVRNRLPRSKCHEKAGSIITGVKPRWLTRAHSHGLRARDRQRVRGLGRDNVAIGRGGRVRAGRGPVIERTCS